jgi:type I restriction enzyme, R subunit
VAGVTFRFVNPDELVGLIDTLLTRFRDVPGRLGQAKRYAIGVNLSQEELPLGGPWLDGDDRFCVPFLFVTNGRP